MARSVSTHQHAIETVYLDGAEYTEDFEFFIEDLQRLIRGHYLSFSPCDHWQGQENHIILRNKRAEVSVSEYCGIVAVCLAPLDPNHSFDRKWCHQTASNFRKILHNGYPALVSKGQASNGEQFFSFVNRPGGLYTSREGVLW